MSIFCATYPLFKLGMIGAGDVKLFAVCAGVLGLQKGFIFLCCTFLVAAVPAVLKMLHNHNFSERFRYFFTYAGQAVSGSGLTVYDAENKEYQRNRIPLAGPACLSVLLSLGGVY